MLSAAVIIMCMVVLTVTIHLEGLWYIRRNLGRFMNRPRIGLSSIVLMSLGLHAIEIALYAVAFLIADRLLAIGQFSNDNSLDTMAYFYYSAVTFTAVGYGDILPTGELRLLAVAEPLNGLMLISWSGAFTFLAMQRLWTDRSLELQGRRARAHREASPGKRPARIKPPGKDSG